MCMPAMRGVWSFVGMCDAGIGRAGSRQLLSLVEFFKDVAVVFGNIP